MYLVPSSQRHLDSFSLSTSWVSFNKFGLRSYLQAILFTSQQTAWFTKFNLLTFSPNFQVLISCSLIKLLTIIQTFPYLKALSQTISKSSRNLDLCYCTENSVQCYIAACLGGKFGGECKAESLCCPPETSTTLLISYIPI